MHRAPVDDGRLRLSRIARELEEMPGTAVWTCPLRRRRFEQPYTESEASTSRRYRPHAGSQLTEYWPGFYRAVAGKVAHTTRRRG